MCDHNRSAGLWQDVRFAFVTALLCTIDGRLAFGTELHPDIEAFFEAQRVNVDSFDNEDSYEEINTSWLSVKHIDEIVSFTPDGYPVVADEGVCYALLLWIDSLDQNATIRKNREVWDLLKSDPGYMTDLRASLESLDSYESPVKPVVEDKNGSGTLKRGGVFFADLPDDISTRTYEIVIGERYGSSGPFYYSVSWWDDGDETNTEDADTDAAHGVYYHEQEWRRAPATGPILTDTSAIYKDAGCFILRTFWDNPTDFAEGDVFTFAVNANCKTFEMPVLFKGALAHTIDHVNCLVDNRPWSVEPPQGPTVITGHPFDIAEDDEGKEIEPPVVKDYVQRLFNRAGYTYVVFGDSWIYNDNDGDIHCGTNARRVVPNTEWWK